MKEWKEVERNAEAAKKIINGEELELPVVLLLPIAPKPKVSTEDFRRIASKYKLSPEQFMCEMAYAILNEASAYPAHESTTYVFVHEQFNIALQVTPREGMCGEEEIECLLASRAPKH